MILYIVVYNISQYRRYKFIFELNNRLYKYLKKCSQKNSKSFNIIVYIIIKIENKNLSKIFIIFVVMKSISLKFFANNKIFNIIAIKGNNNNLNNEISRIFIIQLIINLNISLNTKYNFRNYIYIKINIILSKKIISKKDCFNNDIEFNLINRKFLLK